MARYNNRRIISSQQTIPVGKLLPGMIITFNYSEAGVTDPRPILLFLPKDFMAVLLVLIKCLEAHIAAIR